MWYKLIVNKRRDEELRLSLKKHEKVVDNWREMRREYKVLVYCVSRYNSKMNINFLVNLGSLRYLDYEKDQERVLLY